MLSVERKERAFPVTASDEIEGFSIILTKSE